MWRAARRVSPAKSIGTLTQPSTASSPRFAGTNVQRFTAATAAVSTCGGHCSCGPRRNRVSRSRARARTTRALPSPDPARTPDSRAPGCAGRPRRRSVRFRAPVRQARPAREPAWRARRRPAPPSRGRLAGDLRRGSGAGAGCATAARGFGGVGACFNGFGGTPGGGGCAACGNGSGGRVSSTVIGCGLGGCTGGAAGVRAASNATPACSAVTASAIAPVTRHAPGFAFGASGRADGEADGGRTTAAVLPVSASGAARAACRRAGGTPYSIVRPVMLDSLQ